MLENKPAWQDYISDLLLYHWRGCYSNSSCVNRDLCEDLNHNVPNGSYFKWLSYLKRGRRIWSVIYCFIMIIIIIIIIMYI